MVIASICFIYGNTRAVRMHCTVFDRNRGDLPRIRFIIRIRVLGEKPIISCSEECMVRGGQYFCQPPYKTRADSSRPRHFRPMHRSPLLLSPFRRSRGQHRVTRRRGRVWRQLLLTVGRNGRRCILRFRCIRPGRFKR